MVVNGTTYNDKTDKEVVRILEACRQDLTRIRIVLGNVKTGESWNETYEVTGYVGRSLGPMKVPILLRNDESISGGEILTYCIIGIRHASRKDGGWMYKNPLYKGNE